MRRLSRRSSDGRPEERHRARLSALRRAILEAPAHTDPTTRTAAASGGFLPEPTASYVAKVRDQSYRITDRDMNALRTAGVSEDAIFELTVAAAVGAALRRLDAGMRAMRGEA
jgi:hypothetical protein